MLMPNPDPIFLRASVSDRCNLHCIYCPKTEGMENRVPSNLRGHSLSVDEYCINLEHLARNGLRGISFSGGEPTLNSDLPIIVARAAELFDRVELTTNGRFLTKMIPSLTPYLDILKVSLDAIDSQLAHAINNGSMEDVQRAVAAIRSGCSAGIRVGVNVVVMRSTVNQIENIIDLCKKVNSEGLPGKVYVSLLDFYYSEERRLIWEQEFFPIVELEARFISRYGPSVVQERFGCRFFWFDADGVQVRFKDSYTVTHRAPKCRDCQRYCQEGIYGLMHSIEGWVTTCPNDDPAYGVHLSPGLSAEEVDLRLGPLLKDIQQAKPDHNSFVTMLTTHGLDPALASGCTSNNTSATKGK